MARTSVAGFDAIVLQNERLRAVVLPALGGRIWELEDRRRQRQWIWHRDDVPLRAAPPAAVYDDVWAGGWEELFPNDAPGWFEGRDLPDHGEWWTTSWKVTEATGGTEAIVRLNATTSVVAAACSKTFRLRNDDATLSVAYSIRSLEQQPFHFLFKQHLAVDVSGSCRLALPGGTVSAVDSQFGTDIKGAQSFAWPISGDTDLRKILPPTARKQEFVYIRDLGGDWCGVDDTSIGASLRMRFDARSLPYVWLFLSYGGWRDAYTAVLEPCTNMPKNLAEAVRLQQSARLDPGAEFTTTTAITLGGLPQ